MKRSHIFEADDGTTFATAAGCKQHEEMLRLSISLSGLTQLEILRALDRTDTSRGDSFERAGNIITNKRRESGFLKHAPKKPAADGAFDGVVKAMAHETASTSGHNKAVK